MQLRETPTFNTGTSPYGIPTQGKYLLANNVINQPRLSPQLGQPAGKIPTNLNYTVNQPRSQSFNPAQNNKLDINLNINVNQDGTVTAQTGQNVSPIKPNFGIPNGVPVMGQPGQPLMGTGPRQFLQGPPRTPQQLQQQFSPQILMGYPMGAPPVAHGHFTGVPLGGQVGGQFPSPYGFQKNPGPSYIGYKKITDQSVLPPKPIPKIDTTIQQSKIFCVICQQQYLVSHKDEHIRKHQRINRDQNKIKNLVKQYKQQHLDPKMRPIVQPEQYNIQYQPNQFILQQQTNFATPVFQPPSRSQFGIGTSDQINQVANSNSNRITNQNISPVRITGLQTNNFQPQPVRLTGQGQRISYLNNNAYQGQRVLRQTIDSNIQPIQPASNDGRFTRNTFISDQQSPALNPGSQQIYNRQTLRQSMGQVKPTMVTSQIEQPQTFNQNTMGSSLPIRNTVYSQNLSDSGYQNYPPQNRLTTQQDLLAQKIAANHQSVMSPIRQQTQNRNTLSQGNLDQRNTQPIQNNIDVRQTTSYITPTATSLQQGLLRNSTLNPQPSRISINTTQKPAQPRSIFDQFDSSPLVIPRQSKLNTNTNLNTNQSGNYGSYVTPTQNLDINNKDIPISAIIQDRLGQ